jgi:ferredoxin-NADP reductase
MGTAATEPEMRVRVTQVRWEAEGVISLGLAAPDGSALQPWEAGAHLEITLPSGRLRQYSLCGLRQDRYSYTIAVLRETAGRGGSSEIHDTALIGRELIARGPRNHFALGDYESYVFVAGGIGITPILSMIRDLAGRQRHWVLYYGGQKAASMAFTREILDLAEKAKAPAHLLPQDVSGLLPLTEIVSLAAPGAAIYACGPAPMLTALRSAGGARPEVPIHSELFTAPEPPLDGAAADPRTHGSAFTVVLARTGERTMVENGMTLLDAVRALRPEVPYSCEEGFCGSCETKVLSGAPVHRDTVLSEQEHSAGASMMICVGSCSSAELVLDL